jgi:hypothetical protein
VASAELVLGWDDVAMFLGDHLSLAVDGNTRVEFALLG